MSDEVTKSGEPYEGVYTTSFGMRVAVPKSEAMFYVLLGHMRNAGMFGDFAHRTFELNLFLDGFKIVA